MQRPALLEHFLDQANARVVLAMAADKGLGAIAEIDANAAPGGAIIMLAETPLAEQRNRMGARRALRFWRRRLDWRARGGFAYQQTRAAIAGFRHASGGLGTGGGAYNGSGFGFGTGAFSMPLGQSFGAQLDAIGGGADGDGFVGGAGHLFWRDPSKGLLGIYGSVVHFENSNVFNAGGHGNANFGPQTIGRIAVLNGN
jgi:hypothetical protein